LEAGLKSLLKSLEITKGGCGAADSNQASQNEIEDSHKHMLLMGRLTGCA